jgi:hypothetical protein
MSTSDTLAKIANREEVSYAEVRELFPEFEGPYSPLMLERFNYYQHVVNPTFIPDLFRNGDRVFFKGQPVYLFAEYATRLHKIIFAWSEAYKPSGDRPGAFEVNDELIDRLIEDIKRGPND